MIFPLAIAGVCALTSIIGTYFVRLGKNNNIMAALYRGFAVSAILSAILLYFVTDYIVGLNNVLVVEGKSIQFTGMSLFICAGCVVFAGGGLGVDRRPAPALRVWQAAMGPCTHLVC